MGYTGVLQGDVEMSFGSSGLRAFAELVPHTKRTLFMQVAHWCISAGTCYRSLARSFDVKLVLMTWQWPAVANNFAAECPKL